MLTGTMTMLEQVEHIIYCFYQASNYNSLFFISGDQGLMFGYATDETEECMPLTVVLSHKLNQRLSELRRDGTLWWACPDTKSQVSSIVFIWPLRLFINHIWCLGYVRVLFRQRSLRSPACPHCCYLYAAFGQGFTGRSSPRRNGARYQGRYTRQIHGFQHYFPHQPLRAVHLWWTHGNVEEFIHVLQCYLLIVSFFRVTLDSLVVKSLLILTEVGVLTAEVLSAVKITPKWIALLLMQLAGSRNL